jgi:hypothetical protein
MHVCKFEQLVSLDLVNVNKKALSVELETSVPQPPGLRKSLKTFQGMHRIFEKPGMKVVCEKFHKKLIKIWQYLTKIKKN